MTRLNVQDARCEALFVSDLQRSDTPTAAVLAELVSSSVRRLGVRGCACRMAEEFGDHPEAAAGRMRWIRQLVTEMSVSPPRRCAAPGRQRSAPCCADAAGSAGEGPGSPGLRPAA